MRKIFLFILLSFVITTVIVWIPIIKSVRGESPRNNLLAAARINPDPFNPMAILESGKRPIVAEGPERNCTYTDFYWTLNTDRWPNTVIINHKGYSREEGLELISANRDDVSERLMSSLLVAYLNIYKGADISTIVDTIQDSETWLAGTPDDSILSNFRRQMGVTLASNLRAYNNGLFGPGLCPDQPEPPTPTPTPTAAPASTLSSSTEESSNQLQLFFENLFSGKGSAPTTSPTPTRTSTQPSQQPAANQPAPSVEDQPAQPIKTPIPPPTNTQPPPATETELPPPAATDTPPPENPRRPPQGDDGGDSGNGNGGGNGNNGNGNNGENGNGNGNGGGNGSEGGSGNGNGGGNGSEGGSGNGNGGGNGNGNNGENGNGNRNGGGL